MTEDDDLLAAEHALGLTDASERIAADPAFAEAVEGWRARLLPMLGPDRAPPPDMWDRIVRQLPANDAGAPDARLKRWRIATFGASALAAALLAVLIVRPQPAPLPPPQAAAPAPMLVASLMPEKGPGMMTVAYDRRSGRMLVNPVKMDPHGRTPELWVIPADGRPRSLGTIPANAPATMPVAPARRAMLAEGVTIAVSLEPSGGSPTGLPTGPVVMAGKIVAA